MAENLFMARAECMEKLFYSIHRVTATHSLVEILFIIIKSRDERDIRLVWNFQVNHTRARFEYSSLNVTCVVFALPDVNFSTLLSIFSLFSFFVDEVKGA